MDPNYAPHLEPQRGSSLKAFSAVCVTLTGIAIILRFWSRATTPKRKFDLDDWTALASWPLVVTSGLLVVEWTGAGFGRHITEVPLGDVRRSLKLLYAGGIVYNVGITMVRFSAILFYNRIFAPHNSRYRYLIWASLGLNAAWGLAFGALCTSTLAAHLSTATTSALMDLLVLLLPLPPLWTLHTNRRKKARLLFIFFVGYCVFIFTIGRLVSIAREGTALNNDFTWAFVTPMYWLTCELSVASISISLPIMFHLVKRATNHGSAALFNAREYPINSPRSCRTEAPAADDGFVRLKIGPKIETKDDVELDSLDPRYI